MEELMAESPTTRSLKWLRDQGYTAQKVEYWNSFSHRRVDFFGIIDIIAVNEHGVIMGVQSTDHTSVAKHITKAKEEPRLRTWLLGNGLFEIHGWGKQGARGKRKTWTLRRVPLRVNDLP
jgi:hypothetical protein